MTAQDQNAGGTVHCLVAEGGRAHAAVTGIMGRGFVLEIFSSPDDFLSAAGHDSRLVAVIVDDTLLDEKLAGRVVGWMPPDFAADGGPLLLLSSAGMTPERQELRAALNACRVVDPLHGADALFAALSVEVEEFRLRQSVRAAVEAGTADIGEIEAATFRFRTREEAKNLATMLASACREKVAVAIGLTELFVNAVEHGCLNIGHGEKGRLIEKGRLADEIKFRRSQPEYADRHVTVEFSRSSTEVRFHITDPGDGFDYTSFVNAQDGHVKKHGRGITMAGGCFDEITYLGKGNEVIAVHRL